MSDIFNTFLDAFDEIANMENNKALKLGVNRCRNKESQDNSVKLNESKMDSLRETIIDILDIVPCEEIFDGDGCEFMKDTIRMGIDDPFEVAQMLIDYLDRSAKTSRNLAKKAKSKGDEAYQDMEMLAEDEEAMRDTLKFEFDKAAKAYLDKSI